MIYTKIRSKTISISLLIRTLQSNIYMYYGFRLFNRPIFAIIFFHRIVIRTPKIVREDIVVPLVITSHVSDWINSASWAVFSVSALALALGALLSYWILWFKAAISALCALFSLSSPWQSLVISEMRAYKRVCQLRNGHSSSIAHPGWPGWGCTNVALAWAIYGQSVWETVLITCFGTRASFSLAKESVAILPIKESKIVVIDKVSCKLRLSSNLLKYLQYYEILLYEMSNFCLIL